MCSVCPCAPECPVCLPCVSRLPPVSFYRLKNNGGSRDKSTKQVKQVKSNQTNLKNQPQNQPHPPTHAPDHTPTPERTRVLITNHTPLTRDHEPKDQAVDGGGGDGGRVTAPRRGSSEGASPTATVTAPLSVPGGKTVALCLAGAPLPGRLRGSWLVRASLRRARRFTLAGACGTAMFRNLYEKSRRLRNNIVFY